MVCRVRNTPNTRQRVGEGSYSLVSDTICSSVSFSFLHFILLAQTDMALSLGLFSSILPPETHSLSLRPLPPTSFRMLRAITSATVSQSQPSAGKIRGIMKPRKVSPEMQALVGVPEISRTQALKNIWAYIKDNNLQDPENKRVIRCDEKLKKVFAGRDQVGMLEIAGLISPHFLK